MQTFLPYADYAQSAAVLDQKRLGKQRVECLQILNTLLSLSDGWANHPIMTMWRGYETSLVKYGVSICKEWQSRGYSDTVIYTLQALEMRTDLYTPNRADPPWLGDETFHISHQSNLLKKAPHLYLKHFPYIQPGLPYIWPDPSTYWSKRT